MDTWKLIISFHRSFSPNLSSLFVVLAISEMGSDDVLDAKMVFSGAMVSYSANSFCFSSRFSTTASTTRSAVVRASLAVVAVLSRPVASVMNFSAAYARGLERSMGDAKELYVLLN